MQKKHFKNKITVKSLRQPQAAHVLTFAHYFGLKKMSVKQKSGWSFAYVLSGHQNPFICFLVFGIPFCHVGTAKHHPKSSLMQLK